MHKEVNFKKEIVRAYNVLGEKASCQNYTDINEWLKQGLITSSEAHNLHYFNNHYKVKGR